MIGSVQLRDVIETDLPIFFEQQLDSEVTQMAYFPSRIQDAFLAHWNRILADDPILIKTILFDGNVTGNVVCFGQLGEREVGYWLGKEYWGRGIATQALEQLLKHVAARPCMPMLPNTTLPPDGYWRSVGLQFQRKTATFQRHSVKV